MNAVSFSFERDCKPAKGLSKSYCQGACAIPLSAQTIGDVLFSKEIDPDMTLFTSPEYNQRMTIKELQGKVGVISTPFTFYLTNVYIFSIFNNIFYFLYCNEYLSFLIVKNTPGILSCRSSALAITSYALHCIVFAYNHRFYSRFIVHNLCVLH